MCSNDALAFEAELLRESRKALRSRLCVQDYFVHGKALCDADVLVAAAERAGLSGAADFLRSGAGLDEVKARLRHRCGPLRRLVRAKRTGSSDRLRSSVTSRPERRRVVLRQSEQAQVRMGLGLRRKN